MDNKETLANNSNRGAESSPSSTEQLEKIANNLERNAERSDDGQGRIEKARADAFETAVSVESTTTEKDKPASQTIQRRRGPIGKKELNRSYKQTLKRIQGELPKGSKGFSKVIHNNIVEKTSEALGSTVARPNAILAGSVVAFSLTLFIYFVSKNIGYTMSGFETIAAFTLGWIIGILYDYFRLLLTGKK
ncbi:hypothetical protein HGB25_02125 [Candidatus Saccharibacteria bacterium]|nr:hypothetical protein [Candidatus Saccharibacteria bacterium]